MDTFFNFLNAMPSIIDGPFWFTALVKISLLLAIAWLVHFAIAAINPRWRVVLWRSATVGVVAVLLLDVSRLVSLPFQVSTQNPAQNVTTVSLQPTPENGKFSLTLDDATLRPTKYKNVNANPLATVQPQNLDASEESKLTTTASPTWALWAKSHWRIMLGIVWLLGVVIVISKEVVGTLRLRRLVRQSTQADSALSAQASKLATAMRVNSCKVRISDQIVSPLVFHTWFRVTLLLPKSIADSSEPDEMAAILTHELSHAVSRDLEWNLWIKIISTLLWPHPLLWRVRKTHVAACEFVADAESARRIKDPELYVRTLAKVALNASAADQKLPGLAMARTSAIRLRLERVAKTFGQLPLSRRRMFAALSLSVLGFAALGAFQFVSANPVKNSQADSVNKTIVVHVVDEQKKPLKNHQLNATVFRKDSTVATKVRPETIENGVYRFSIPDDLDAFSLLATGESRVRMRATWRVNDIPDEFTFELPQGTKISGRIVDEKRKSIEGAKVHLLVSTNQELTPHRFYYDYFVTTDKDGNWSSNDMPAELNEIWIRLEHPDFISDNIFGQTVDNAPVEALRDGSHVAQMKRGALLRGTVTDEAGKPIQGATVYQGGDRWGSKYPSTTTDEAGVFQFQNYRPGQIVLTAVAKGFAPDLKEISATTDPIEVEFSLKPGNAIKIKLVDAAGKPIAKASVSADSWRDHRSLADIPSSGTDADGNWVWDDAPADAVEYDIIKSNYMILRNRELSPSPKVQVVVLNRQLEVTGSVTDAKTGKPIKDFNVVPGIGWKDSPPHWELRFAKSGSAGRYKQSFFEPRDHHLLKVEALGYLPSVSRKIQSNEGEVSIDFELTPSVSLTGKVLTPDGEPAVRAKLIVGVPNQKNEIIDGRVRSGYNRVGNTDKQGRFAMPQEIGPFKLLISHKTGVASLLMAIRSNRERRSDFRLGPRSRERLKSMERRSRMPKSASLTWTDRNLINQVFLMLEK